MNTITHALLPVFMAGLVERVWRGGEKRGIFEKREFLWIGILGAAPDLLSPHISLQARLTSYSHTLLGMLFVLSIVMALLKWRSRLSPPLGVALFGAYLLHLICDLIAGGIAPLYPFRGQWVVGGYWVSPVWWIPADILLILMVYWMFRILPNWRNRRSRLNEF